MTEYLFAGKRVTYREYGAGAAIVQSGGGTVADFPNHLDAEAFLELLPTVSEGATVQLFPDHGRGGDTRRCATIKGLGVQICGDKATIEDQLCPIHGNQPHIYGYDDMENGVMPVCLKCCAAIYAATLKPKAAVTVQHAPKTCDGFENMGKPVPNYRRQAAYDTLAVIGVADAELRRRTVTHMAYHLERDEPYYCVSEGMRVMDLTATYRVMAVLLTAPEQDVEDGRAS